MKAVIVGGGVAGLAIGWRLAESGLAVEVIERGLAGRASSWAAAGMLAATAETGVADDAHAQFARMGLAAWPEFAAAVERASGQAIGFRRCGALLAATSEPRAKELRDLAAALGRRGEQAKWLTPNAARELEPLLTGVIKGALHAPDDGQVDNRRLGGALADAFIKAGGRLREHTEARGIHLEAGRAAGVLLPAGVVTADCVIVAAGAWTNLIAGAAHVLPPVRPAKGQMAALAPAPGAAMPRHLIWGEGPVYLVPRGTTLLVGATVEDRGFDTSVSREVHDELIGRAAQLVPSLRSWRVAESWAGLRPRTQDDLPVLGETSIPGLYVASGQYRNGILFAPVIAEAMRDFIMDKKPVGPAAAFAPGRLAGA